jgi:DNA polymerase-3 subunit gamma/tau
VSRFDFRRVPVGPLVAHLSSVLEREQLGADEAGLQLIARASDGSVRDAMTLLEQAVAFARDPGHVDEHEIRAVLGHASRGAVAALVGRVLERDAHGVLCGLDEIVAAGQDLVVLALQILHHLRDLLVVRLCDRAPGAAKWAGLVEATGTELERLREQASRVEPTTLGQMFDRFGTTCERLPGARMQRVLLEMSLLELVLSEPMQPLGGLVERLEALSRGTTGRAGPTSGRAPAAPESVHGGGGPEPSQTQGMSAGSARASASPGDSRLSQDLWRLAQERGVVGEGQSGAPESHGQQAVPGGPAAVRERPDTPSKTLHACAAAKSDPPTSVPPVPAQGCIPWEKLEPFVAWERLLACIRQDDELFGTVLRSVGLVELGPGRLRLGTKAGSYAHAELGDRPERRAELERALLVHFGDRFAVEIVDVEASLPDVPSAELVEAERAAARQAELEREARAHPGIQEFVRTFNAQLRSVKPI